MGESDISITRQLQHSARFYWALFLALALLLASSGVRAASGDLDTGFGVSSSGINYTNAGGGEKAFGITLQSDNKIILVGTNGSSFMVARYTPAGLLDTAGFGGGAGYVLTPIGANAAAYGAVVQNDGAIVVVGSATYGANTHFALARYLSTGALDPSFGVSGVVTSTLSAELTDEAHAVVIDNNNKIVVGGTVNRDLAVVRYTSAGALDSAFGTGGVASADFTGASDEGWDLAIQGDNKIVVAGFADTGSSDDFALARFSPSGNLDNTFGGGTGKVSTDFGSQSIDQAYGLSLQSDGKLVLAGLRTPPGGGATDDFALARYDTSGSLDLTFDTDGRVTTDLAGNNEQAYDVAVQPTGRIVAAGFTTNVGTTVQDFALLRYTSSGALDATFGAAGQVITNLGSALPAGGNTADYAHALVIQPDNKIVAAGYTDYPLASGDDNFAVARYESPNAAPTLTTLSKTGAEDVDLTFSAADFTAHFSDTDGDSLVKVKISSLPANGTLKLNGSPVVANQEIAAADLGSLVFTPAANFFGGTSFLWNASDGLDYAAADASASLTITGVNDAPVLGAIGPKSGSELSAIGFTAGATDADSDSLTYSLDAGSPTGASINPTTGVFSWTPSEAQGPGIYGVTVRVTDNGTPSLDDSETILITVSEVNAAPVLSAIGAQSVTEGSLLSFAAQASDGDIPLNTLSYSLDPGAPTGAAINPTTGQFTWTPTEAQGPGVYTATVRVTDNGLPTQSDFEAVVVTVSEANVAPVLAAVGSQTVDEGSELTFTASASDTDLPAQTLTYALDAGAPAGAAINPSTGAFSWTPSEAQGPGSYPITVRVSDSAALPLDDFETVVVTVNETNQAPVLTPIGSRTVNEGETLSFTATAVDADLPAQTLTYTLDPGAPVGASIHPGTGAFSWTPGETLGGSSASITIRVTDSAAPTLDDFETIQVTVSDVNAAPQLNAIAAQAVDETTPLLFVASAVDSDIPANNLSYSLDAGTPSGAAITPDGAFTWTPSEAQGPGVYSATVRVTDNGLPPLSDSAVVTITVGELNQAPVLAAIGSRTIDELTLLTFTAGATDADLPANTLTFSLDSGAPAGAAITSAGVFTWTPGEAQGPGVFTLTVRVSDGGTPSLDDFETITVTVNEVNQAPVLADIVKTTPYTATLPLAAADFNAAFSDSDGTSLVQVKISNLPAHGTLALNGTAVTAGQVIAAADLDGLLFTADAGWYGSTSFDWNGFDGELFAAADAQVLLTIEAPPTQTLYLPVVMTAFQIR